MQKGKDHSPHSCQIPRFHLEFQTLKNPVQGLIKIHILPMEFANVHLAPSNKGSFRCKGSPLCHHSYTLNQPQEQSSEK